MGILVLLALCYVYWIGYWQYWARVARRDARWIRYGYCVRQRNRLLLVAGGAAALAGAIYFS